MDGQSYKTRADIAADIDVLEYRAEKLEAEAKQLRQQIAQLEQAAADLGNGNLSERQIARFPIVTRDPCVADFGLMQFAEAAP